MVVKITLSSVAALAILGCSSRPHYQPKAWVSVTKPPIRIIYMDYEKDITAETVHRLTQQVKDVKYEDYKFNENANISIGFDAEAHSSHSDATSVAIGGIE